MSSKRRVLIVDDHAMLRAGCSQLMARWPDLELLEAGNGSEGLRIAREARPDVIVLDLNLPDLSGFDVLKTIRSELESVRVLVFSMYEDPVFAARALEAGAHSFVSKGDNPDTFVEALDAVLRGEDYLSYRMAQRLALMRLRSRDNPLSALTRREVDVLRLFANGKSLSEIAGILDLNYRTVANVMSAIKRKLNVGTTNKLLLIANEYWKAGA